jgi:predicted nucleic acid-binding protein/predicted HTH domain antitoxin
MAMEPMTETTTIYDVLALVRTLSPADRSRLAKLFSRAENAPLPEHASIDEATELYLADACSLGKAAELAGVTRWNIIARLKERGIPVFAPGEQTAHELDAQAEQLRLEGIVVSTTNILSSLTAGGSLPALWQLFARAKLVIPPAVQQELQAGLNTGAKHLEQVLQAIQTNQIEVSALSVEEEFLTYNFPSSLNEGELQAIAIAQKRRVPLLCNDTQAIHYCEPRGITVINLVTILRLLWARNVQSADEVRRLIRQMELVEGLALSSRQVAEIFAQHEGSE